MHVLPGHGFVLCPEIVIDENVEQLSVYLSFVSDSSTEGHIDDADAASPKSNGGETVRYTTRTQLSIRCRVYCHLRHVIYSMRTDRSLSCCGGMNGTKNLSKREQIVMQQELSRDAAIGLAPQPCFKYTVARLKRLVRHLGS